MQNESDTATAASAPDGGQEATALDEGLEDVAEAAAEGGVEAAAQEAGKVMERALTRDEIFEAKTVEKVEVPELGPGGFVFAQPLPYALARKIIKQSPEVPTPDGPETNIDVEEWLDDILIYGIVDENHERIFQPEDAETERISNLPFGAAMRMAHAVLRISGITEEGMNQIEGN